MWPAYFVPAYAAGAVTSGFRHLCRHGRPIQRLRRRRGRHTTIVIAHRISTLMDADQILVLDHGQVIQRGTHVELKDEPGLYRRIWHIQNAVEEQLLHDLNEGAGMNGQEGA